MVKSMTKNEGRERLARTKSEEECLKLKNKNEGGTEGVSLNLNEHLKIGEPRA